MDQVLGALDSINIEKFMCYFWKVAHSLLYTGVKQSPLAHLHTGLCRPPDSPSYKVNP